MISLFFSVYLSFVLCDFGYCKTIEVDVPVIAITTCESGDAHNFGTIDWNAVSVTNDTGAFQFNDATWAWVTGRDDRAKDAPQAVQLEAFYTLWNDGYGWTHWNSSKACWQEWLTINEDGRAVPKNNLHLSGIWGVH